MSTLAVAHGHAARATMRWLNGRPVRGVSLQQPIDHAEDPAPRDREGIEDAIRLALAAGAGEMLCLGAPSTYLQHHTPGVAEAMQLARKLPGRDPIDVLEEQFDHLCATLRSPRVWATVQRLAAVLSERRSLDSATAAATIKSALLSGAQAGIAPHPRTVRLVPDAPKSKSARLPNMAPSLAAPDRG